MIQNSAIKSFHEFHVMSYKDLQILMLAAPFLLLLFLFSNKCNLIVAYVRSKVQF